LIFLPVLLFVRAPALAQSRNPDPPPPSGAKDPESGKAAPRPVEPAPVRQGASSSGPERQSVGPPGYGRFPGASDRKPGITWEAWWYHNKDGFLEIHDRFALGPWTSGPGDTVFLGRERDARKRHLEAYHRRIRSKVLPVLLEIARKGDRQTRLASLFALGSLQDRAAVVPLLEMMGDSDRAVREVVVVALGMIGDARAQSELSAVLNGGNKGRRILGLSRIPQQLRGLAAISLGMIRTEQPEQDLLCLAVRRRKLPHDVRAGAVIGLGLIGTKKAAAELAAVASSGKEDTVLRSLAVTALARTGRTAALDAIVRTLDAKHADVRSAAVLAVAGFSFDTEQGRQYRQARAAYLKDKEAGRLTPEMERARGLALNRAAEKVEILEGPRRKKRALVRLLLRRRIEKYRGPRERGLAALALGSIGLKKDASLLLRLLDKSGVETRGFAALGLGILARNHDPEGKIAELLARRFKAESGNPRLRSALALSLGMTRNGSAGGFLNKEMNRTSNRIVRTYLVKALGMLRHRMARDSALDAVINAREPWVVRNSLLGFALLSDRVTSAELIPRLETCRHRTQRRGIAAAVAFGGIGTEEALEPLMRYVRSGTTAAVNRAFVLEAIGIAGHLEGLPALSRIARGHNFTIQAPVADRVIRLRW